MHIDLYYKRLIMRCVPERTWIWFEKVSKRRGLSFHWRKMTPLSQMKSIKRSEVKNMSLDKTSSISMIEAPCMDNEQKSSVTVNTINKEYCTGCSACYNACSVNAITMRQGKDYYLEPWIDDNKCIECGRCLAVCPVAHRPVINSTAPECYAAMADDDVRKISSSGGMFTIFARDVISHGGYVCGAAMDENFVVHHILVNKEEDLSRLRLSKYVQSNIGDVFRQIKALLEQSKDVLFSGCPCQVAGLKNYLGKEYKNLLTIDIVCHGAPPEPLFQKYVKETFGEKLKKYEFRTKKFGYNSMNAHAVLDDDSELPRNYAIDSYEQCMHSGLALRKICGDCTFAELTRVGDLTIGDFWGISSYDAKLNDNLGTSVLLINSLAGQSALGRVRNRMKLLKAVPFDVPRSHNRFGRKMQIPRCRKNFYTMLKTQSFEKSVKYALNYHFDVGVIGLWYGENYGSLVTYYSLHRHLEDMGLSVVMIENPYTGGARPFMDDVEPYYFISRKRSLDNLWELNAVCDTFLVGSDQLWNVYLSRPYKQMYYLGFASDDKKKISCATSFGRPYEGGQNEWFVAKRDLERFDHISVRDDVSLGECEKMGVNATKICDPAFFTTASQYDELATKATVKVSDSRFILAYILDPNEEKMDMLKQLVARTGLMVYVVLDLFPPMWLTRKKFVENYGNDKISVLENVKLSDWLWLYKHSTAVVTDSYHGTIFSLIYKKPFLTLINKKRGAERFLSLLGPIGLEDNLLENAREVSPHFVKLLPECTYEEALKKQAVLIEEGKKWLAQALYTPKKMRQESRIYSIQ